MIVRFGTDDRADQGGFIYSIRIDEPDQLAPSS